MWGWQINNSSIEVRYVFIVSLLSECYRISSCRGESIKRTWEVWLSFSESYLQGMCCWQSGCGINTKGGESKLMHPLQQMRPTILFKAYKIVVKLLGDLLKLSPNALMYFKSDIKILWFHTYLSKFGIFDRSAFSIHVNNTDVTKAAWCRPLIPASPLWSGSQSKTCIFRGGIWAGSTAKWSWQLKPNIDLSCYRKAQTQSSTN